MRKALLYSLLVVAVALWAACTRPENAATERSSGAAARPTLTIGLVPEQNVFKQLARYEPLAEYLSSKTGANVRLKVMLRYGNIIDHFKTDGLDAAFFSSITYPLAHKRLGVQIIARPVSLSGSSTCHGVLFARKDSGIRTARDMRGKRFAFVDKATTAGYLFPLVYFRKHGIDYRTYLKEFYFAGTHEGSILDVLERKADIGAAKSTIFDRPVGADLQDTKDLRILARSPEYPESGLAVRKDLDPEIVKNILTALLGMHQDPEGEEALKSLGARQFIRSTGEEYRTVFRYAKDAGIDLAHFTYKND